MQVGRIDPTRAVYQPSNARREQQAAVLAARGAAASGRQEVQRLEAADRYGSLPQNQAAGDEARVDLYL